MSGSSKSSYKCLIIDDEKGYAGMIQKMLMGHHREVAHNAADGLRKFAQLRPDITFLDIGLPDGDGLSLLTHIKKITPAAYIIMLTASRILDDVETASRQGAVGYITKPFTRQKIMNYIQAYGEYRKQLEMTASDGIGPMQRALFSQAHAEQLIELPSVKPQDTPSAIRKHLLSGWRVLYAGESEKDGQQVCTLLSGIGCKADLALNEEGLRTLTRHCQYNVIFLSDDMPSDNPQTMLVALRELQASASITLITEDKWQKDNPKWRLMGVSNILVKPVTTSALLQVLESELQQTINRMGERYIV
ncbi:response regulator [bacterium]|nr:response regulator [bacterium]